MSQNRLTENGLENAEFFSLLLQYMHKIVDTDKRISCYYDKRQKEHQRRLYSLLDVLAQTRGQSRDMTRPRLKKGSDVSKRHYVITQH